MRLFDVTGKVVVVTGAAGGLGSAMVRGLAEAGAYVVGADISAPTKPSAHGALFRQTDISIDEHVDELVQFACERFSRIDIMVANAGVPGGARAEDETQRGFEHVMAVNALGTFLCARAAARRMKRQGGGSIINIASVLSFIGHPTCLAYTASKGAILQMTRTMAIEWAKYHIRVNAIAPGFFRTPLNQSLLASEEYMKPVYAKIPLGRIAEPDEIVGTVIYLASDASRFVTGSVVVVDGGEMAAGGYTDATLPFIYDTL